MATGHCHIVGPFAASIPLLAGILTLALSVSDQARAAEAIPDAHCLECHGKADLARTNAAGSVINLTVNPARLAASVHRTNTCHSCHRDLSAAHPDDGIAARRVACAACHASRSLSHLESAHGIAMTLGKHGVASCADCHGRHGVQSPASPDSRLHPSKLAATCGGCHRDALRDYKKGTHGDMAARSAGGTTPSCIECHPEHQAVGQSAARINHWVRRFYTVLIAVVIGLMAAHNALDWLRHLRAALRSPARTVTRLDLCQRLQHGVLLVSFLVLAWTGFALAYPDAWLARALGSDDALRRTLHRLSGLLLLALGIFHLAYVALSPSGRRLLLDLLPRRRDAGQLWVFLRHGLRPGLAPVRTERFGYIEKIEYWAVVWGIAIMGVTGMILWFVPPTTPGLPPWLVEVTTTIHLYEAVLACLAILVWHAYHVMASPGVYPLSWTWWDGRSPETDAIPGRTPSDPETAPRQNAPRDPPQTRTS
ncbi:MAG TPA: cytochrome b/b6 domain-containing protein [Verrucomicrobiota bacterium]|nr:cytochrome b/b6 domain-containing protein [Verrucomicrobiota bacterium]HNU50504.1 cytochrome b/b6 domain-containing protein [Verrucomicrobiota bacterium]